MSTHDFYEQIKSYRSQCEQIETRLGQIKVWISQGCIPSEAEMDAFRSDIACLRGQRASIERELREYVGDTAETGETLPVDAYIRQYETHRSAVIERRKAIGRTLRDFVALQASNEEYIQALSPWMTRAKVQLEASVSETDGKITEDMAAIEQFSRAFLKVVGTVDPGCSENEGLLDQLESQLSPKALRGLLLGKYTLSAPSSFESQAPETAEAPMSDEDVQTRTDPSNAVNAVSSAAQVPSYERHLSRKDRRALERRTKGKEPPVLHSPENHPLLRPPKGPFSNEYIASLMSVACNVDGQTAKQRPAVRVPEREPAMPQADEVPSSAMPPAAESAAEAPTSITVEPEIKETDAIALEAPATESESESDGVAPPQAETEPACERSEQNDALAFEYFISDAVYQPLYDRCTQSPSESFPAYASAYVREHAPLGATTLSLDETETQWLDDWPTAKGIPTAARISSLFLGLGFDVKQVERITPQEDWFNVYVRRSARHQSEYAHPVALFGTRMRSPIKVICWYGHPSPRELVDTVRPLNRGMTIVLLGDCPLSMRERYAFSEIMHSEDDFFLLIDPVLMIHLAAHPSIDRLPLLLRCTLPCTAYRPFECEGRAVPDEMFFGRNAELARIMEPNGACMVYGGRQFGKTALLQRAEALAMQPEKQKYAVYVDVVHCASEASWMEKLSVALAQKTPFPFREIPSISSFCCQMQAILAADPGLSMVLLIDGVDDFLECIDTSPYDVLKPLIDLKRESQNRFKFVMAGGPTVRRAQSILRDRDPLNFPPEASLCLPPLSVGDARRLLSVPLQYLGFSVPLPPTDLAGIGDYPGLLHALGDRLVQMFRVQYGQDGNCWPFELKPAHLDSAINSAPLQQRIRDIVCATLELDPRYAFLARIIAKLSYPDKRSPDSTQGFSIPSIMALAQQYAIRCLTSLGHEQYRSLLDEMVDMGLLRSVSSAYRLRHHAFIAMIGDDIAALEPQRFHAQDEAR